MRNRSTVCLIYAPLSNLDADIRTWFANVEEHASEGVNKILIGNKCDWEEKRVVSTEQGQALADELGIPFIETSAKANVNVEKGFFSLARDIKNRVMDAAAQEAAGDGNINLDNSGKRFGANCC